MKIVYSILGTYNAGGMERVLANKANYLADLGHQIIIITTDQQDREPNFLLHHAIQQIDLGINYTNGQQQSIFKKSWSYWRKQKIHRKKLSSLLNDLKADIVISMFDFDVSFLYKIKDGSKKILEIHFSRYKRLQYHAKGLKKLINRYRSILDKRLARKYERFVVLTHEDLMYWKGLKNIVVIPNAQSFSPYGRAELDNKCAIAVGRLDYQKGFDELILIWKKITDKFPEWQLHIYGEGPLRSQLQDQIDGYSLTDKVFLKQPIKNIMKIYLDSAVALMTSRYEGLPMALLEAQSCGVPMVAMACKCGPKDIIKSGQNGFLIDEGDHEDFAHKVGLLISDVELRRKMGNNAREMAQNFTVDKIMRQWLNLFNSVLQKGI